MADIKYVIRKDGDCERPAVLWAWADTIKPEDLVYQMHEFKKMGIEEVYAEPVWSLDVDDYLSDFFMDMIALVSDTADELGIKFSIYDEYSWPSTVAGGKVIEDAPELRGSYLRWFDATADADRPVEIWYTKGKLLNVMAEYCDKAGERVDITDQVTVEEVAGGRSGRVMWRNNSCCPVKVWVFCQVYNENIGANVGWASFAKGTMGFTDTMNKKAIQKFLDINNEAYRKKLGHKFGTKITRLFSDETSMSDSVDLNDHTVTYSNIMEEEFEKEHGYTIRDKFIALTRHSNCDEDIKVRYDYYNTCARLYREAYIEMVSDWCHKNGIEFTGHLRANGVLLHMALQQGRCYESNSRMDIPGMDTVGSYWHLDEDGYPGDGKVLASVAKFAGKDRTMCETFSGSGWEMRLEDAKRVTNKLMMVGVTYIVYQSAAYSFSEGRKWGPIGYPPSFGFNNPAFYHYNALTDYCAVRSSVMTKTKPLGNALVMLPNVEAWMRTHEWLHRWFPNGMLDACWFGCSMALQKKSIEHDIFFESLGKDTVVEGKTIKVKGYSYDTMIVPMINYSEQTVLDKLEQFAKNGGRLVFLDSFPFCAADTLKKYDFPAACGLSEEGRHFFDKKDGYKVHTEGNVMLVRFTEKKTFESDEFRNDISSFVRAGSPEYVIECDDIPKGVYIARRDGEGLRSAFVFNDTDETKKVTLRINSSDDICVLEGVAVSDHTAENGKLTLEIPPHEMPMVMLKAEGVTIEAPKAEKKAKPAGASHTAAFDKEWHFTTVENNMLPLQMRYLTAAEPCKTLSPELQALAETADSPHSCYAFPGGVTFGSGYAAAARFEVKDIPEYLELFNEVTGDGELWLNGHLMSGFKKVFVWGAKDSVTDITPYVKKGTNTLVMINRVPSWGGPHGMPWCVVRGGFRLDSTDAITVGDSIVNPDIYTAQGWRYFGGNCCYSGSFNLTEQDKGRVVISIDTTDIVEVVINGVSAGELVWRPFELDITELCKAGKNTVELKFTTNYLATMGFQKISRDSSGKLVYNTDLPYYKIGLCGEPVVTVFEK